MRPTAKDLKLMASLDEAQLQRVAETVSKELPCSRAHLRKALDPIGVDSLSLTRTIGHYLSLSAPGGRLHGRTWETLLDDLRGAVGEQARDELKTRERLFREIFAERNAVAYKGAVLQHRLLPHIAEFSSLVDLRPVFDEKHDVVHAYVPSIILQLSLHSEDCDRTESWQFQITRELLDEMIATLEDARKKLRVMVTSARELKLPVLS